MTNHKVKPKNLKNIIPNQPFLIFRHRFSPTNAIPWATKGTSLISNFIKHQIATEIYGLKIKKFTFA